MTIWRAYQHNKNKINRAGNSDEWRTQNCPPQNCPPKGISRAGNSEGNQNTWKWDISRFSCLSWLAWLPSSMAEAKLAAVRHLQMKLLVVFFLQTICRLSHPWSTVGRSLALSRSAFSWSCSTLNNQYIVVRVKVMVSYSSWLWSIPLTLSSCWKSWSWQR